MSLKLTIKSETAVKSPTGANELSKNILFQAVNDYYSVYQYMYI